MIWHGEFMFYIIERKIKTVLFIVKCQQFYTILKQYATLF